MQWLQVTSSSPAAVTSIATASAQIYARDLESVPQPAALAHRSDVRDHSMKKAMTSATAAQCQPPELSFRDPSLQMSSGCHLLVTLPLRSLCPDRLAGSAN